MRANAFAIVILLAACAQTAAAKDLYQAINRVRAGDTTCARTANVPPLSQNPHLERAANALTKGETLARSVAGTGYRATRTAYISIGGETNESKVLAILQRNYCAQLLDPAFADIGIHHGSGKISIVLAAPFAPRVDESAATLAPKALALVNDARATPRKCGNRNYPGAHPVRWNQKLGQAAQLHADDMARFSYFKHEGRDGSKPAQRVARAGYEYRATGENLAGGSLTLAEAVADWIKSPGHCANLMSPDFTEMGLAFAVNKSSAMGVYWVQVFGTPR